MITDKKLTVENAFINTCADPQEVEWEEDLPVEKFKYISEFVGEGPD